MPLEERVNNLDDERVLDEDSFFRAEVEMPVRKLVLSRSTLAILDEFDSENELTELPGTAVTACDRKLCPSVYAACKSAGDQVGCRKSIDQCETAHAEICPATMNLKACARKTLDCVQGDLFTKAEIMACEPATYRLAGCLHKTMINCFNSTPLTTCTVDTGGTIIQTIIRRF